LYFLFCFLEKYKNIMYNYLIVGAGLYGAMFAYKAMQAGKKVLVIDKRSHVGGNLFCESVEDIDVHKYGAHIFHTSNKQVWDFVNSFVEFNRYTNSPIANYKGELYNLPFNMNTFYQMWGVKTPKEAIEKINEQRKEAVDKLKEDGVEKPRNLEEQALILVGKDLYEKLVKGYTEKQWGRQCTELPSFIIRRLPIRLVFDNNYFNDKYQGIPIGGYNRLINKLLQGADVKLECDFFFNRPTWDTIADKIVFTGKIDEYYNYQYGKLEYRTVFFEEELLNCENFQGNAVVNYTDREVPYTRIIEHKHFDHGTQPVTIISREFPMEWKEGCEPYYPINDEKNMLLYNKYKMLAQQETRISFGGRLAEYRYYDMHQIVEKILNMKMEDF